MNIALEHTSPQLNTELRSPSQLLQSTIELHAHFAENKEINLRAEAQADLPAIQVDSKLIEIAFSNLISNAIKYSEPDSDVVIYTRSNSDNAIQLGVLDEGPGIPEEDTEKVFGKFYRSTGTQSKEGTGLGLSICKDIVTAHGGQVAYRKRNPKGSDFYFTLPPAH